MNRLLFLFLLLVPSLIAQPAPFLRNAWTTNAAGTPVQGQDNLSVTNLGSGTNWLFHSVRPQTIARLIDITNVALAVWGGTNYWTNDPPGYLSPITVTNSVYTGTNQSRGYFSGDLQTGLSFWGAPSDGLQFFQTVDASLRSFAGLEGLVLAVNPIDSKNAYLNWVVRGTTNDTKRAQLNLVADEGGGDVSNWTLESSQHPTTIASRRAQLVANANSGPSNVNFVIKADMLSIDPILRLTTVGVQNKYHIICQTNNSNVFRIADDGNIANLRRIAYSWPTSQGAAQSVLTNNGAGVLGWGTAASGGGAFNINQFEASATHTNIKSAALLTNIISRNITNAGVSVTMASGVELRWPGFTLLENVPGGAQLILNGQFNAIGAVDLDSTLLVNGVGTFDTNVSVLGTNIVNWGRYPLLTASRALVLNADNGVTVASGAPDGTKFLRDDNTYAVPPGGSATPGGVEANLQVNMGGAFVGSTNMKFDVTNSILTLIGSQTNTAASATAVPMIVDGAASQATNIMEWRSNMTVVSVVSSNGWIGIGTNGPLPAALSISKAATPHISLRRTSASAGGGMLEFFNSAGSYVAYVSDLGVIGFNQQTALDGGVSLSYPSLGLITAHGSGQIGFAAGVSSGAQDIWLSRLLAGHFAIRAVSASGFGSLSASNANFMGSIFITNNLGLINTVPYVWPTAQGAAQTVLTNDGAGNLGWGAVSGGPGGGITTNANQFGPSVELTIKSGALLTNVLFYPSNLTGPATIHLATTAQVTNLTEWRQTNGSVGLSISSNGLALVQERLDLANAVAFRTNNIDFRLNTYQAFTASLKTNLVLQLTNTYEGVTTRLDAYGAGRLGGGSTNAWQLLCTVASGVNIYWPPGTTNGNYDVLVNSNQVVSFTFMGGLGSTNILASYRVLEGIGAN